MTLACPTCGDALVVVPNDDPAYGPATLYYCETAGAAHIPFGWTPDEVSWTDPAVAMPC